MPSTHLSLGYRLVERNVVLVSDPKRTYRGLDRQPDLPGPAEDAALAPQGRRTLLELRNRYWDLEDARTVQRDPGVAVELCNALKDEGISVEVVLADVLEPPAVHDVHSDLVAAFERQLERWSTDPEPPTGFHSQQLGIDVVYPFPSFHSAIRQPVLDRVAPKLLSELNDASLLTDDNVARRMAALANRSETAWRPFCMVRITQVGSQPS